MRQGKILYSDAVDELKAAATYVIGSNECDGVARWLAQSVRALEE